MRLTVNNGIKTKGRRTFADIESGFDGGLSIRECRDIWGCFFLSLLSVIDRSVNPGGGGNV